MATQEELLLQTEAYRDETKTFRDEASSSKTQAQSARVQAQAARDTAEQHKSDALQAVADATAQKELTITVRDAAVVARNEAISAKTTTNTKAAETATNAADALAAKAAALAAQTKAQNWADYPRDSIVPGESSYSARHWAEVAEELTAGGAGNVVFYGAWDAAIDGTPPTPDVSARYYITSDGSIFTDGVGGTNSVNVYAGDTITYSVPDAEWFVTSGSGAVSSVNGKTGGVSLDYGDFDGAQDIKLDNSVQIKGLTGDGLAEIPLVSTTVDDKAYFGHVNYRSYLRSSLVPRWKNSTNEYELIHTGGGQILAGHLTLEQGKAFKSQNLAGNPQDLLKINANDNVVVGSSNHRTIIYGDGLVPRWWDGTAAYDLIHSGGWQILAGPLTFATNMYGANGGKYAIDLDNGDIINTNTIAFHDTSQAQNEGLVFKTGVTLDLTDASTFTSLRVDEDSLPRFWDGTTDHELIHSGGGQQINGGLTASGGIFSTAGNFYSTAPSASSNVHYWLRDSNNKNRGLLYSQAADGKLRLRTYDTDGTTVRAQLELNGSDTGASFNGALSVNGAFFCNGDYLYGDGKVICRFNDDWLRLNNNGHFTSGTYVAGGLFRCNPPAEFQDSVTVTGVVAAQGRLDVQGAGETITIDGSGSSHYIGFYRGGTANGRTGYIGHGSSTNDHMYVVADEAGANLNIYSGSGGKIYTNSPVDFASTLTVDRVEADTFYLPTETIGDFKVGRNSSQYVSIYGDGGGNVLHSQSTSGNIKYFSIEVDDGAGSLGAYRFGHGGDVGIEVNGNTVWHEGNDGAGSGLDADLLDGLHASSFARAGARTDNYIWARRDSVNSAFYVTNQSTGQIASFRSGAGDGSEVASIENNGAIISSSDITSTGNMTINGGYLYGPSSKQTLRLNDAWLRLNPVGHFTSGIYCGSSGVLRHDGGIQLGAGKSVLSHDGSYTSGKVTFSTSAPSGGSNGDIWFEY